MGWAALLAGAGASAQSAAPGDPLYEAYLSALAQPLPHVAAVSNHFRHTADCGRQGCVIMGPTQDRDACEDWVRAWNRLDPYDHARCVEVEAFGAGR